MKELEEEKIYLQGQADVLKTQLEASRNETTSLIANQATQNKFIEELQQKLIDTGKDHESEKNALKANHEQGMVELKRDMNALKEKHEQDMLELKRDMNASKEKHEQEMLELKRDMDALRDRVMNELRKKFMEPHVFAPDNFVEPDAFPPGNFMEPVAFTGGSYLGDTVNW